MRNADERRLWSKWRNERDEAAFARLVEPHLPFAVDLARRLGCDAHDADDIAQQSLAALAAARDDRPTEVGLRAWVGRHVSLGVKTLRRARRRRIAHEDRAPSPPAATATADLDNRDAVDAALAQLDPDEREVVVLRFLHDLEYREVAYVLGIGPAAARLRVHRALCKLRARLGKNASAMIAAGVLWTGSKSTRALVEGVWIVSKSVKVTLVAALALIAALFSFRALGSGDRGERASGPRAAETARSVESEPEAPPLDAPDVASLKAAEKAIASMRPDPWAGYESVRAAAALTQRSRKLIEQVRAIAPETDAPEPGPDSTARLYLEELIARYRTMAEGDARAALLTTAATAHRRYVEGTHDLGFLPFFEGVLADAAQREQVQVVASLTGLAFDAVVDLLLRAAKHPEAPVRADAVGALADMRGDAAPRAHRAVRAALGDPVADVRWSAAVALEFSCGTADDVPALLDRIGREDDPIAMHAMIQAVRALDPTGGEQRVQDVLAAAPREVEAAGEEALAHEVDPQPFRVPGAAPAQAAPPSEEDASTRTYLERLGEELLTLPEGEPRERKYRAFSASHAEYVRKTQRADLLPLLRRLVERSAAAEQRSLLSSLGRVPLRPIVDQLVAWTKDDAGSVRSAAAQGLVWVGGDDEKRATAASIALLADPVGRVRLQVAMALRLRNRPAIVTALIDRLSLEPDDAVVYALVITATSMDKGARERIAKAMESMPAAQAQRVQRALDSRTR